MELPDIDDDTLSALMVLLEGIENRKRQPQLGLTYGQEKLLCLYLQKIRFELAASKMPTYPPLPKGVASTPPVLDEAEAFKHWDTVLEKISSAWKETLVGLRWDARSVDAAKTIFYDICVNQVRLSEFGFPDLSLHVSPVFPDVESTGTMTVRLHPKTSMGRRYIVSRQPKESP